MLRRRRKLSLFDLIVIAVGLMVLAALAFLVLRPVIRSTKRGQIRETISAARLEVSAFAKSQGRLPSPREFSTIAKNTDPWGGTLFYMADGRLVSGEDLCCAESRGFELIDRGAGKQGIAFIIVSEGKNRRNDTGHLPPFVIREEGAGYDDFVAFMSIEELRSEARCDPVQITSAGLPAAAEDLPYSARLSATVPCGKYDPAAFLWSIVAGNLPAGLSLSPSGSIEGTPDTAPHSPGAMDSCETSATFTVKAEHLAGLPSEKEFTMSLVPQRLKIKYVELPPAMAASPYTASLKGTGGEKSYSWAITEGELPPGLALNPTTGVIEGRPGKGSEGIYTLTVTLSDGCGGTARRKLTMSVDTCAPLGLSSPEPLTARPGQPFSASVEALGGYPPYSHLPESCSSTCAQFGIALDCSAKGVLATGIPSGPGSCSFSVAMTDRCPAGAQSARKTYVIRIEGERARGSGEAPRGSEVQLPSTSD